MASSQSVKLSTDFDECRLATATTKLIDCPCHALIVHSHAPPSTLSLSHKNTTYYTNCNRSKLILALFTPIRECPSLRIAESGLVRAINKLTLEQFTINDSTCLALISLSVRTINKPKLKRPELWLVYYPS